MTDTDARMSADDFAAWACCDDVNCAENCPKAGPDYCHAKMWAALRAERDHARRLEADHTALMAVVEAWRAFERAYYALPKSWLRRPRAQEGCAMAFEKFRCALDALPRKEGEG